jgi:hypothetical protein
VVARARVVRNKYNTDRRKEGGVVARTTAAWIDDDATVRRHGMGAEGEREGSVEDRQELHGRDEVV